MRNHRALRTSVALLAIVVAGAALAACGSDDDSSSGSDTSADAKAVVRAGRRSGSGYFPNVTHAPALVGIQGGIFKKNFGKNVTLETTSFNAGGDVITAILAGELDASFIGPGPSISGFQKSNGEALRIVSGATSGGAYLVVKPDIKSAGGPQGQDDLDPAARQHAGRGAPGLAQGQGPRSGHLRRRRRAHPPAGQLADPDDVPVR